MLLLPALFMMMVVRRIKNCAVVEEDNTGDIIYLDELELTNVPE